MKETRSGMARKKMALLTENCNGEMQAKATSGHEHVPSGGCVGKFPVNQNVEHSGELAWFASMESNTVEEEKCVGSKNGLYDDTDDSVEERNSNPESGSTSSEEINTDDTSSVNGIKPRRFYSSQNERQQTRSAISIKQLAVQRNKPKVMANKTTCNAHKDTQCPSRSTTAVKRKHDKFSNVVPAKKVRRSERYSSANPGRTFRDKVFGRCNGRWNGNIEDGNKSRGNLELCNGSENGRAECSDKESTISSDLQDDMLCSFSDSSDAQSGHSLHQAFSNGCMKSDFEMTCSEGSDPIGLGVPSSGLVQKTNGTEHDLHSGSSLDFDSMISEDNKEHREDPESDELSSMLHLIESESSQKPIHSLPTCSSTSGVSFTPSTEDFESTPSSARSSPENQASITKYFTTLPGQMSKNKNLTQRNVGALCTSPLGTGKKSKSRSPRKSSDGRRLEQMYLDLGQKDFGHVTCQTCGMVYTKAQPDDEAEHMKHHKRFVGGLKFMGWKNEHVVQEFHDGRVIMVTPDDHSLHTKKVEEIRKVVDAELGFASDPPFRRQESKTFLFISNKRVVGCAVAIQIDKGYPVLPSNCKDTTPDRQLDAWCCSSTPQPAQCGISRIWVYSSFRRKKIATRLIDSVRTNFIYGCVILKDMLAFSDPTPDGKRLAQSYAGTSQFLVFR